ncbi:peptidoglycan-binding protein, partial [Rhizobium johnstonii]
LGEIEKGGGKLRHLGLPLRVEIGAARGKQHFLLEDEPVADDADILAVEAALQASEEKDRVSQTKIADLGSRLNVALAARVQELNRYRSDFFGRLRE